VNSQVPIVFEFILSWITLSPLFKEEEILLSFPHENTATTDHERIKKEFCKKCAIRWKNVLMEIMMRKQLIVNINKDGWTVF